MYTVKNKIVLLFVIFICIISRVNADNSCIASKSMFNVLPKEIIKHKILEFCSIKDLLKLELVNKQFYDCINKKHKKYKDILDKLLYLNNSKEEYKKDLQKFCNKKKIDKENISSKLSFFLMLRFLKSKFFEKKENKDIFKNSSALLSFEKDGKRYVYDLLNMLYDITLSKKVNPYFKKNMISLFLNLDIDKQYKEKKACSLIKELIVCEDKINYKFFYEFAYIFGEIFKQYDKIWLMVLVDIVDCESNQIVINVEIANVIKRANFFKNLNNNDIQFLDKLKEIINDKFKDTEKSLIDLIERNIKDLKKSA